MLDHKHLISKGTLNEKLTTDQVKDLIDKLVIALDMRYVEGMPINPVVGYEYPELASLQRHTLLYIHGTTVWTIN